MLVLRGHLFCFLSKPQRPMTSNFSIPDFIHYIYFPILIFEKEPVFPFLMFSAKQVNYWYHIYMFKTSRDFDSFHALFVNCSLIMFYFWIFQFNLCIAVCTRVKFLKSFLSMLLALSKDKV